ncbi:MAG: hypothetical protein QG646_3781, partial [Euryarchaeota archaeon]|nr:hypothetical protein [Euryarchaeota archaeon]
MTFFTPFVQDKFTVYKGDTISAILSLAISLIDDFTKKVPRGHLKVIIKEGNINPIK